MNNVAKYNSDPTGSNPVDVELKPMILVPLLDTGFETSLFGCSCSGANGLGSGQQCLCGSENGGGQ